MSCTAPGTVPVAGRPRARARSGTCAPTTCPAGRTSADAAGLPILPGLANYDEVLSGHIDHAIRMTAQTTDTSYVWPARHEAGAKAGVDDPQMGARFRLSARFHLRASRCARPCQVVIRAMQTYGLIVADNVSNWFFQGTLDRRWTDTMVDQLKQIPARAFQAVDESCLRVDPNSGQARQPGSVAYGRACDYSEVHHRPLLGRGRGELR